jgi:GNAT superfamily N-acetyltransferase
MPDWGPITLVRIESGDDFWSIMDELKNDKSGFLCNRDIIVGAYRDRTLFGLRVAETESMSKRNANLDNMFAKQKDGFPSVYLLPCFCISECNRAIILWVHARARLRGFGKKLVEELKISIVDNRLPASMGFWEKCGIRETHEMSE